MKKIIYLTITIGLFILAGISNTIFAQEEWRSTPPKPGPAPKIQIGESQTFTLDNGLKVIVVENHKLPRISYRLFVDAPEIMEGNAVGYIDFMGQLLSRGTTTKSKAEIDETVDFMGANLSTSSSGLFASSLSRHTGNLLEIMADVVKNPTFPEAEFEKVKTQNLSALAQSREDPQSISDNVSAVLTYGKKHPYGEIMTEKTIENINVQQIKKYYENFFRPNYSYLIVVGDTDVKTIKPLITKYFGDWKKGEMMAKEDFRMPQAPDFTTVDFVNKTGAVQSVINITYPVDLKPGSADAIKARVANTMLGGYFQSRLNDNLRETKGYTYGARSRLSSDKLVGNFNAYASVRNEVTDSSVVEFVNELKALRKMTPSAEELNLVKSVIAGNFARLLERPETVARFALNTARYNLPEDYYANYLEELSKVTAEDVQEMSRKYFLVDNAHIVIVGNQDEVAEKLGHFSKDGQVRYYDVYGNEMKLDETPIPDGVTAKTVVADYIAAIGGKAKLEAVKDLHTQATASMQGMNLAIDNYFMDNKKMVMKVSMQGNTMQSVVFDGTKAKSSSMGNEQMLEGDKAAEYKESALMFPELFYENMGYKLELTGIEKIDGKDAYKIVVESPNGKKSTDFYDKDTKLKVQSAGGAGGNVSYMDYKPVDGIQMPHKMKVSGGGTPMPLTMEMKTVEINKGVDATMFEIK